MKKTMFKCVLMLLCLIFAYAVALAHGGKTDASGGHKDSKDISGLGPYHYHHGYEAHIHEDGVCPFEEEKDKPKKKKPQAGLKLKSVGEEHHTESFVAQQ